MLDFIIVIGILFVIVRNFRNDKAEGRSVVGGGKRIEPPTHEL